MNENNIKVLFPEGVETITISKNDYDRLFGQLTYENIVLQSKIDKAIEWIEQYEKQIGTLGETSKSIVLTDDVVIGNLLDILKKED